MIVLGLSACAQPVPDLPPTATPRADGLSEMEAATLASLTKINHHPFYSMHYSASYDYDAVISQIPSQSEVPQSWACSLFAAFGDPDNMVYGRNFDWEHSPAILLYTDPPDGYASVSMVDITYLGFSGEEAQNITDLPLIDRSALLITPFLPFDGMNEHGLTVGMAAVPDDSSPPDPQKSTIDSLVVIRLILDRARTVDEALEILQAYNIEWGNGPALHYLVADASGRAILVEFYRGKMVVTENHQPWLHATNFIRASVSGQPQGQCWRYDILSEQLAHDQGNLSNEQAQALLASVSQQDTQWSVVYGINSGEITIKFGGLDHIETFFLKMTP